jgi:hypothetical protein
MGIYWAIFLVPAIFLVHPVKFDRSLKNSVFFIFGIILLILIGFRHEVGGDWFRYVDTAYGIQKGLEFDFSSFYTGDYAYRLVHWISVNYLNGIYSTNLICALFFVVGLIRFCRFMPIPWIALLVSTPFLIVIVSMGYTRQAAAIGFLMWGLIDLINGKKVNFYVLIIIGSFFHLTALIMLPIGLLYSIKKVNFFHLFLFLFTVVFLAIITYSVLGIIIKHMLYYYITIEFHHSDGAIVRVLMNFFSVIIFFSFWEKYKRKFTDEKLWLIFSIVSIILLPISFYYSTFADRVAIYFIPLQLIILSRVPVLIESAYNRTIFILSTMAVYFATLFVWLFFGNFSSHWLPYQNLLLL